MTRRAAALLGWAVRLEEHDLSKRLGEPYQRYLREVPRFVPRPRPVERSSHASAAG
jgi:protein-S-isoprenylcysteine O-methyltransferase Ste14